jgi:hypothetical protein
MKKTFATLLIASAAWLTGPTGADAQAWNSAGLEQRAIDAARTSSQPAPRRDLTGIWDAGGAGIAGPGHTGSPFTPWAEERLTTMRPGNGPRAVYEADINDPLSTICDPAGFPRLVLYETRPFQVVQTANQVLILYMFEKRWRVIWTDGRALPKDPDPRWYGYSVGRWVDDTTFVVETIGMDERTWLDNAGNPHSGEMKVEERYHRVSRDTMELTVTIADTKAYARPWLGRDNMPLALMPANTDLMEMICSPTEVQDYRKFIDDRTKSKTQ